jgi:allantoinase
VHVAGKPRLIVPYALDTNDFKFATSPGWMSGEGFFAYLKAAFDQLHREGEREPKMMSIGLHARLVGRPGPADALAHFMDYVQRREERLAKHPGLIVLRRSMKRRMIGEVR